MTTAIHAHYKVMHIRHFDIDVPVVTVGKAAYFPLKTLCERMGISPQWQIDKVRRLGGEDSRWAGALRKLDVPSDGGGTQPTQCLHRQHLGRWLDSLDPPRVSITVRGPLTKLQTELERAADLFLLGAEDGVITDEVVCSCGRRHVKIDGEWSEEEIVQ